MTFFDTFKTVLERKAFLILVMLFVIGLAATAVVLPWSYIHWIDDVMINEFGRFPIGPHQFEWNMNWYANPIMNAQTSVPFYFGGMMLEFGYRLMGETGPRTVVFLCFLGSVFFLFFYLNRKSGDSRFAALMALLYFSYPLLPVFIRGARVEGIAFLFISVALWIFRFRPTSLHCRFGLFAVAGALCALAVFTWITALLLCPLVLWELLEWIRDNELTFQEKICGFLVFAVGGLLASLLLLIPFYSIIRQDLDVLLANFDHEAAQPAKSGWKVKEFVELFFGFPGLFVIGLPVLFLKRRLWLLAIFTWVGLCVCVATRFYSSRMVYFLPIAILGVTVFWLDCKNRKLKGAFLMLLVAMTILSYVRTCVVRNLIDYEARSLRDYVSLKKCMEVKLGHNCRVYNASYQLYYVGRDLEWNQFKANERTVIPPEDLYPLVDHYVCNESDVSHPLEESLAAHGFRFREKVFEQVHMPTSWLGRLLHKPGRFTMFLGPYRIYDRWVK